MKFPFTYLLLCLAIAGCHAGTQIENFEQARRPEGITLRIETRGGIAERVEGELLEVRGTACFSSPERLRNAAAARAPW